VTEQRMTTSLLTPDPLDCVRLAEIGNLQFA
jgi:hypothetical protein